MIKIVSFIFLFIFAQLNCFCEDIIKIKTSIGDLNFVVLKDFGLIKKFFERKNCSSGFIYEKEEHMVFKFKNLCSIKKIHSNKQKYDSNFGTLFVNENSQIEISIKGHKAFYDKNHKNFIFAYLHETTNLEKILQAIKKKNKIPFNLIIE